MAATMGGALKATIESLGLGLSAYRDGAPVDQQGEVAVPYPHVVVQEGIGLDTDLHGDTDDPAGHLGTRELVQVTLVQQARQVTDGQAVVTESYPLADRLIVALNRCTRTLQQHAPWRVYGCRVQSALRSGPTDNVVRHVITLAISRDTERLP